MNFTDLQIQIIYLKQKGVKNKDIADRLNCDLSYIGRVMKMYDGQTDLVKDPDGEFIIEASKIYRQKQKLMDQQRIERKIREKIRRENAVSEYTKELVELIKTRTFNEFDIKNHSEINKETSAIIQVSDLHLNELIALPDNKFDFKVAARRLRKYAIESMRILDAYNITDIVIAFTGDLINSDRRLDELLNMSTNRAKASLLTVLLLEQFILELSKKYNIKIASISGNESRMDKEWGSSEAIMSYNYDWNINEILKLVFRNSPIEFVDCDPTEQVINVCGQNFLLIHGNQLKGECTQAVQKIVGKYSIRKVHINYVIFGHLHESRIAEYYARSSSLCGANAYSDRDLQLISRASQNIHIVQRDSINTIKIDLQNANDYEGYDIDKTLEAYNAKSYDKIKRLRVPKI